MERKAFGQDYFLNYRYPIMVYRVSTPEHASKQVSALDYSEKKHGHDFSELVIVTQGTGVHWVEGMEFNRNPIVSPIKRSLSPLEKGYNLPNLLRHPCVIGYPPPIATTDYVIDCSRIFDPQWPSNKKTNTHQNFI